MPASPRRGASSDRKRQASSGDRTTPEGCRSSRLRATGRESAAAVPRRARRASCGFVNRRPRRRIEPSVRAQISSASRETSGLSPDSRTYASANEPPASAGGTTRIPRRRRLSGSGSRSGRLHSERRARTPGSSAPVGGSGERGDDLGLGTVARAAPLRREGRPGGRRAPPRPRRRRGSVRSSPRADGSAPSGPGRAPGEQDRARHRRHRLGEAAQTLPLVRVVEDGPPARVRAVGARRDAPPEEKVEHPARDLGPVVEIVARRHGQGPRAERGRKREERLERVRHREHESRDLVAPEDGRERRRVIRGLPERRRRGNGASVHGGDGERERRRLGARGDGATRGPRRAAPRGARAGSRARGCRSRPSRGAKSPSAQRANPDGRGAPCRTIKPSIVGYPRPPDESPKVARAFSPDVERGSGRDRRRRRARTTSCPEKIAGGVLTYQQIPLRRFTKLPEETRLRLREAHAARQARVRPRPVRPLGGAHAPAGGLISSFLEALKLPHDGPSLTTEGRDPGPGREDARPRRRRPPRRARRARRGALSPRIRVPAGRRLARPRGAARVGRAPRVRRPLRELAGVRANLAWRRVGRRDATRAIWALQHEPDGEPPRRGIREPNTCPKA